jgi:ribose 1,5-bisphosphokinase
MNALRHHSHRLLVVVGASGAGKDSVLNAWLDTLPPEDRPHRARRTITRTPGDPSEAHEPADEAGFAQAQSAGEFAFSWHAHGLHYGIRHAELAPLANGRWVVMNGSRAHLAELRAVASQARVIEIVASDEVRSARLAHRAREQGERIGDRLARRIATVQPDLRIPNDGELSSAVAHVDHWWRQWVSLPEWA